MPIPKEELSYEVVGSISKQILETLDDEQGYYTDELLAKIKCHKKTLYRELGKLKRRGLILSKTMPDQSKKLGKSVHAQVYFRKLGAK